MRIAALIVVAACSSSKPSSIDAGGGGGTLGSGAACDTSDDQCSAGLKCCTQPTAPPHANCIVPTGSGTCPLVP